MPSSRAAGLGDPDGGHLRDGEDDLRHQVVVGEVAVARAVRGRPSARAAMTAPQTRPWYLPMWVSSARPLMSPTAYSQSPPPVTVMWSSVVDVAVRRSRRSPTSSSPRRGGRRAAGGHHDLVDHHRPPSTSTTVTGPPWILPSPWSCDLAATDRSEPGCRGGTLDAGVAKLLGDQLARERLVAAEQRKLALEECHLARRRGR